jgi:hypothetical protein
MAKRFNREAEGKGKGDAFPKRLLHDERDQEHDETKKTNHNRQCVLFREILFHDVRILHEAFEDGAKVVKQRLAAPLLSAKRAIMSAKQC